MKEKIDALIANESTQFTEEDRPMLQGLDESVLDKMVPVTNSQEEEPGAEGEQTPATEEPQAAEEAPAVNAAEQERDLDQKIQTIVRQVLVANQNASTIDRLVANKTCPFNRERLETLTEPELKALEASITQGSYLGAGGATPVANEGDRSVPDMPTMDFSKEG